MTGSQNILINVCVCIYANVQLFISNGYTNGGSHLYECMNVDVPAVLTKPSKDHVYKQGDDRYE